MPSEIKMLGFCKSKICILRDMLDEKLSDSPLHIYLNIDLDTSIDFYTQPFDVVIHQPGVVPDLDGGFVFAVSGPKNKKAIFTYFYELANIDIPRYISLIDPSVSIARSSLIQPGCVIESLVSISSQTEIGFGTDIKRGAQVGHHNRIGKFCDINPGAVLCGNVTLGKQTSVGAGAVIKDRVTIGENTVIGMGSVVTKDIPDGVIAFGNPCKVVRENPYAIIL